MPSLSDNEVKIKISTQADNSGITSAEKSYQSLTTAVAAGNAVWDITKNSLMGIKDAVIGFVQSASDVEMLRASLDTLTGSAESGKKMFSDLYTMAAKTPFETTDLVSATKVMLGYGIAQEKITDTLSMLGDVAMGDKNKLSGLALSYSQVQSTGKLMGQDLLQMINAGFNPLGVIAKETGKSMATLKDEMAAGSITADMVTKAFKTATSEGGLYFQGMDKGSKTLNGTWSTLQDNIGMMTRKMVGLSDTGDIIEGGLFQKIGRGINMANSWFDNNKETVDGWSKSIVNGMSLAKDSIIKLSSKVYDIGRAIGSYLYPKLENLWTAIDNKLIPLFRQAWDVINPLIPLIGESLVWGIGASIDALAILIPMFTGFVDWCVENKDFLLPIIAGLGALKTAFMINDAVGIARTALVTFQTVTIPGVIASMQTLAATLATPMAVAAIGVGAIVAVYEASQKAIDALNQLRGAVDNNANISETLRQKYMSAKSSGASKETIDKYYKAYQSSLQGQINVLNQAAGIRLFSSGGYTGQGGVNEVAGIVHKGEYVVPKNQVDQSTGLPKASAGGIVINNTNYFNRESDSTAYVRELGYMLSRA